MLTEGGAVCYLDGLRPGSGLRGGEALEEVVEHLERGGGVAARPVHHRLQAAQQHSLLLHFLGTQVKR